MSKRATNWKGGSDINPYPFPVEMNQTTLQGRKTYHGIDTVC